MLVSDLETAGDASEATCESVEDGTITASAIYETGPVCEAVICATPIDVGATEEEGILDETPNYLKSE